MSSTRNELADTLAALQTLVSNEPGRYGIGAFLIKPTGEALSYARMIDQEVLKEGDLNLLRIFGDDIMLVFQKSVNEE